MSEIIGISATELERLSVLALSGTPALPAGQVYDVDGQRYRWTGTAWEKRWRSQWLPVRAETNEAGEVVRVATSTIDLPVVTYQTSPGGGIGLTAGGRTLGPVVSDDLPIVVIGGDHPYKQWFGRTGRDGLAGLYASRGIKPYCAINTASQSGEGVGDGSGASLMTWDECRWLQDNGLLEFASHGARHYQKWDAPNAGLHIRYTGAAATASAHVTATHVVGTSANAGESFSLAIADYPTLSAMAAAITALPGWTGGYSRELTGDEPTEALLTIPEGNAKSCITARSWGTYFAATGGISIFWDSNVTPCENAYVNLTTTSMQIIRDGVRIASFTLSTHTLASLLAAVRAIDPALATVDVNGMFYTDLINDGGGATAAYCTGGEAALNLTRGMKYTVRFDLLRSPANLTTGLHSSYLRYRNAVVPKQHAAANGVQLPTFIQSGRAFYNEHAFELADEFAMSRGNPRWDIVDPCPMPRELVQRGFRYHISFRNNYNTLDAAETIVEAIAQSRGVVIDMLIHGITTDATPDDGSVAGSSGYYLRTPSGPDMTEGPFVRLLDRLAEARDAGRLKILAPSELMEHVERSRKPKNLIFNPRLVARKAESLAINEPRGRLVTGWDIQTNGFPFIAPMPGGGLEWGASGGYRDVLRQRVLVEAGKRYALRARIETAGNTNVEGVRFNVQFARGQHPDTYPGRVVRKISSEIITVARWDLAMNFWVPPIKARGYAKIISLNTGPYNLITNKNIRLVIENEAAISVDCSAGAASVGAVTAAEVAAAINAAVAASAAFANRREMHTIARVENNRVVLEVPQMAEVPWGSGGRLNLQAGATASACTDIFGGIDGFAWPDPAGPTDPAWYPVDVILGAAAAAGTRIKVHEIRMHESVNHI